MTSRPSVIARASIVCLEGLENDRELGVSRLRKRDLELRSQLMIRFAVIGVESSSFSSPEIVWKCEI